MEFSVMMGILMEGFALTAEIFLITLVGSLPLGVVVALARMSKFKPLAWLAQLYISILRGTPLMLQLMAIMFGPYYIFGLNMGSDWKFWACAIGFILNYAAYFAEIYRSGIQSIPRGQYEAAEVLGYTKDQHLHEDVLPQVISVFCRHGQRGHHVGERHVARLRAWHHGDVLRCEGLGRQRGVHGSLRHRGSHLLGVLPAHRIHPEPCREASRLLPRLGGVSWKAKRS